MEMSNPKGQHLELVFPLPSGTKCFSWAIHTTTYTYLYVLYLHLFVYSRERRLQSLGRAEVPWDRRCATAWRQPLPHSVYDLSKLGLQFTELKYMWPSDFPKLAEEACNGPENGLHVCQVRVQGFRQGNVSSQKQLP